MILWYSWVPLFGLAASAAPTWVLSEIEVFEEGGHAVLSVRARVECEVVYIGIADADERLPGSPSDLTGSLLPSASRGPQTREALRGEGPGVRLHFFSPTGEALNLWHPLQIYGPAGLYIRDSQLLRSRVFPACSSKVRLNDDAVNKIVRTIHTGDREARRTFSAVLGEWIAWHSWEAVTLGEGFHAPILNHGQPMRDDELYILPEMRACVRGHCEELVDIWADKMRGNPAPPPPRDSGRRARRRRP